MSLRGLKVGQSPWTAADALVGQHCDQSSRTRGSSDYGRLEGFVTGERLTELYEGAEPKAGLKSGAA